MWYSSWTIDVWESFKDLESISIWLNMVVENMFEKRAKILYEKENMNIGLPLTRS